ncbi:hypothetical protein E3N88_20837 [Mikania micrantha]|uniref:Nascent polypeptide-associated complex subunit beta n=1 Tax=Mikania micrantha TaxID=192012 RepID=A0A5N6NIL4_9ASTR|nr:hypothetical protein E3N88_20837 [Mikania micrantha]
MFWCFGDADGGHTVGAVIALVVALLVTVREKGGGDGAPAMVTGDMVVVVCCVCEREKKKAVHKTTSVDGKRLQDTLKRLGVNGISQIEEITIFKDDTVIQFLNPKVQASIPANTWVVSGTPQTKRGPESFRKLAEQFQKQASGVKAGEATTAGMSTIQEDDDEVPELVAGETFEAAAEEGQKS